ncbi:MAG: hypothetical protein KY432_11505, partial [Acidobacteria bacterium]|nr:hypothetical protein [Acidobacteriota bacterium]
ALLKVVRGPAWPELSTAAAIGGDELLEVRIAQLESGREPRIPLSRWRLALSLATMCAGAVERGRLREAEQRAAKNAAELAAEQERFLDSAAHLEALVESDRLKTGILRAVSHDLATPLATVTLQIEALERELIDFPDNLGRVTALRQDIGMLRHRIENLLAMARIESGTYEPHPEPVPPSDLFRLVRHHLAVVAPSRPLEIRTEPGTPDLYIDPSLALEILGNLVDNAHRASAEGVAVELVAFPRPGLVVVEVLDRGHGLRGSGTMTEGDAAPSGLGLDIARSLAEASRAVLELGPREGGGTVARILIPAFDEESES